MALTRKLLKGMGLTDEQVETIIEAHTDTTDGLKAEAAKYKADADKLPGIQAELDGLKAKEDDGWKDKYEKVKNDFNSYKQSQEGKAAREAKEKAYRALLKVIGISEKRMDTVVKAAAVDGVLDSVELDDKGAIKDAAKLSETVKADWGDFIVTTTTQGVRTPTPAANSGGGMTREDIVKIKDPAQRRAAIAQNMGLFEGGN